jgi:hypothetical protein
VLCNRTCQIHALEQTANCWRTYVASKQSSEGYLPIKGRHSEPPAHCNIIDLKVIQIFTTAIILLVIEMYDN